jgi:GcrA cell cycle regulator
MAWTDEQREAAIRLWRACKSAAFIADELGPSITRNAVVGMMHRLGIRSPKHNPHSPVGDRGFSHSARTPRQYQRKRRTGESLRRVVAPPAPIQTRPVSLLEAGAGDCRWPLHDCETFEEFKFCGAATGRGSSYCAGHHVLVYRSHEPRRPARNLRNWRAA